MCPALWTRNRCADCTHVSKFPWVTQEVFLDLCQRDMLDDAFDSVRGIIAVDDLTYFRFDDLRRFIVEKKGKKFMDEKERGLRAQNAILR